MFLELSCWWDNDKDDPFRANLSVFLQPFRWLLVYLLPVAYCQKKIPFFTKLEKQLQFRVGSGSQTESVASLEIFKCSLITTLISYNSLDINFKKIRNL